MKQVDALTPTHCRDCATLDKLDSFISLIYGAGLVAVVLTFNNLAYMSTALMKRL
jgi:hypothetical protein